jgi:hypothetical protein
MGLVPRRYQSGEVDYTGSIFKCGDRRVRTLLYEAANVMLTCYKGALKLKECIGDCLAIDPSKGHGLRSPGGSPSSCMPCSGTAPSSSRLRLDRARNRRPKRAPERERRPREG